MPTKLSTEPTVQEQSPSFVGKLQENALVTGSMEKLSGLYDQGKARVAGTYIEGALESIEGTVSAISKKGATLVKPHQERRKYGRGPVPCTCAPSPRLCSPDDPVSSLSLSLSAVDQLDRFAGTQLERAENVVTHTRQSAAAGISAARDKATAIATTVEGALAKVSDGVIDATDYVVDRVIPEEETTGAAAKDVKEAVSSQKPLGEEARRVLQRVSETTTKVKTRVYRTALENFDHVKRRTAELPYTVDLLKYAQDVLDTGDGTEEVDAEAKAEEVKTEAAEATSDAVSQTRSLVKRGVQSSADFVKRSQAYVAKFSGDILARTNELALAIAKPVKDTAQVSVCLVTSSTEKSKEYVMKNEFVAKQVARLEDGYSLVIVEIEGVLNKSAELVHKYSPIELEHLSTYAQPLLEKWGLVEPKTTPEEIKDKVLEYADAVKEGLEDTAADAKEAATDLKQKAKETASDAKESAQEAAADAKEAATDLKQKAKESANNTEASANAAAVEAKKRTSEPMQ